MVSFKEIKWQKTTGILLILLTVLLTTFLVTEHDAFLYHEPIAKVIDVKNSSIEKQSDEFGNEDYYRSQILTVKFLNGTLAGQTKTIENKFSGSNSFDLRYYPHQQVFVRKDINTFVILGVKRDTVAALLFVLVGIVVFFSFKKSALGPIFSVLINTICFFVATKLDVKASFGEVILIYSAVMLLFMVTTIFFVYGINRKAMVIFGASTVSCLVTLILIEIDLLMTNSSGLHFETMSYVTQSRTSIFIISILMGSIGAIMDVSGDITVSVSKIFYEDDHYDSTGIFKLAMTCGRNVVGPSVNVLFLIFMASTIPMTILFLKNGNDIIYSISMIMSLGIFQTLASAVAIVLVIPITSALLVISQRRR